MNLSNFDQWITLLLPIIAGAIGLLFPSPLQRAQIAKPLQATDEILTQVLEVNRALLAKLSLPPDSK
jgi:hypothetical protein